MAERSSSPELITVDGDDDMTAGDVGGASLNQSASDFVEPAVQDVEQVPITATSCPPVPAVEEPASAGGGRTSVLADSGEDGTCCTICFDSWSNSGAHRIASLRCGHLFGQSCIERWLRGREQRCPHCNEKASVRDIRAVFAKSVRVLDTSERDRALKDLSDEKEHRRKLELDYSIIKVECKMQENEIARLQRELLSLQQSVASDGATVRPSAPPSLPPLATTPAGCPWSLALQATVSVSRTGGCRVMRHNQWLGLLAVSQPSQNALFPGHGVRKVNTLDMRACQHLTMHSKQVRDLAFHPEQRDLLLSVALDGRAVLTNVASGARVQAWTAGGACWSCAWDRRRQHCCYVGLSSGAVMAVDWRRPDQPLCRLECAGSAGPAGPVVGLCHVAHSESVDTLVVCRLSACSLVKAGEVDTPSSSPDPSPSEPVGSTLPLAGPFTSLAHVPDTGHVLVSARPSARAPHAAHAVCQVPGGPGTGEDGASGASVVQLLHGDTSQRLMSRSALLPAPQQREDQLLVAAGLESMGAVQLWSASSGAAVQRLSASAPVLDVCSVEGGANPVVTMLNENQLKVYSWHERE